MRRSGLPGCAGRLFEMKDAEADSSPDAKGSAGIRRGAVFSTLLLPAFLMGLGRGFTVPVLPIIARDDLGVAPAAAGAMAIAPLVGSFLATLPAGYLADRIGRRKLLIAGPLLAAATSFLMYTSTGYAELIVYLALGGMAQAMWQVSRLTAIADAAAQRERGRQITAMSSLNRLGGLTGPFLGGLVGEFVGLRVPFLMYGVMALVVAAAMDWAMQESAPQPAPRTSGAVTADDGAPDYRKSLFTFPVIILFVTGFASNVARGGSRNAGPYFVFAAYWYAASPSTLGLISLAAGLASVPLTLLAGHLMDRFGRKSSAVPGSVLLTFGLTLMASTAAAELGFWVFIVAFMWIQLAAALMAGSIQTLGSDLAPAAGRGSFFGTLRLMFDAGTLTNPASFTIVTAAVAGSAGFAIAFFIVSGFGVATAALVAIVIRETLAPERQPDQPTVVSGGGTGPDQANDGDERREVT